ncbi:hypothetical protein ACFFK0_04570 [Paenibacillus chartarius]|uniref:DUF4279 domain-containing protein n=1 Tax=Paenibacillus chartarius TaxID=747481 RepID=A0ABV6DGG9_9BACL
MPRLLIKHAVGGRTFIDSGKQPGVAYVLEPADGSKWLIEVRVAPELEEQVAELLRWKDELNVFIFHTLQDGRQEKVWYYTGNGGISYDEADRLLRVISTRELRYLPSEYWE